MLFILILLIAFFASFFFYKKTRRPLLALLTILLLIFIILECLVYGYFVYQCYLGKGLFLIGNQTILDTLYKFRLIYAVYYCQHKSSFYYRVDDELGYTIGRNKRAGGYISNSAGVRSEEEYTLVPKDGILRIACFGDSFVHCDEEKNEDTWEYYLEKSVGNLEVLNFGVGGYGLVQSYLRYLKDGLRFCPDIIFSNYVSLGPRDDIYGFLGVAGENGNLRQAHLYRVKSSVKQGVLVHEASSLQDLFNPEWRNENIYNKLDFYKKNKFLSSKLLSFSNLGLLLKTSYIKYKIRHSSRDVIDKMPNAGSDPAEDYNLKLLENYKDVAKRNNSVLIFVVSDDMPLKFTKFFQENSEYVKYYNIMDYFKRESTRLNPGNKGILNRSNHYNSLGNRIYAASILDILKENEWSVGGKIFYYDKESNSFLYRRADDIR